MKSSAHFIIKRGGEIIFDSISSGKDNIVFYEDHFEIYSRPFSYRGVVMSKK
jgi:hypothetical protein